MSFVKFEKQGNVAVLTIDRPEALNALNSQVLCDLDAAISQVEADDEVRVWCSLSLAVHSWLVLRSARW